MKRMRKKNIHYFFGGVLITIVFFILFLIISKTVSKLDNTITTIIPTTPNIINRKPLEVKGSIPYWDQQKAFASFQEHVEQFNYINLFWYYAGKDGSVIKYQYAKEDKKIISFAHDHGVKVSAVITNLPEYTGATWDSERIENILSDSDRRTEHIQHIIDKLNDLDFDGIIIDYESVHVRARNNFTLFIQELSEKLRKHNKITTVVLHPKSDDRDKRGNGGFQDWKALTASADQIQIMGYGEHGDTNNAGAIASIPWLKRIVSYSDSLHLSKEKIFLGIPTYGYDWNDTQDTNPSDLTFIQTQDLIRKYSPQLSYDENESAPYFHYKEKNDDHTVWYENAKSIDEKVQLAKSSGFGGITFWRLGEEDPAMWDMLR